MRIELQWSRQQEIAEQNLQVRLRQFEACKVGFYGYLHV